MQPPLVIVEGRRRPAVAYVERATAQAGEHGWTVVRGWAAPLGGDRVVCTGWIRTADDAGRALLAAVAGAGLVVSVTAGRDTTDRLLDDLRRLGLVDHVPAATPDRTSRIGDRQPSRSQRALLGLLAEGMTLREAASELGVARRTADRRLAAARRLLGVESTTEAVQAALARR